MTVDRLLAAALYTPCDPNDLPFTTTEELDDIDEVVGQERAVAAVRFGIGIRLAGFNLYCLGPKGTGKASLICQYLKQAASAQPVADDWCYVYNFSDEHRPQALRLPAGRAIPFRTDMGRLVEELQVALPALFESEEFRTRKQTIDTGLKERNEQAFAAFQVQAAAEGISLIRTPVGLALAPVKDGSVLTPEDFSGLPEDEQAVFRRRMETLQGAMEDILRQIPHWEHENREAVRMLIRELARYAVDHLIDRLKATYADISAIGSYLDDVHQNVIDNVGDFIVKEGAPKDSPEVLFPGMSRVASTAALRRFQVNVIVSREGDQG
ncbi:MAG: ATP-dependent protease, partial [Rhodospirillaceae bacterium]